MQVLFWKVIQDVVIFPDICRKSAVLWELEFNNNDNALSKNETDYFTGKYRLHNYILWNTGKLLKTSK